MRDTWPLMKVVSQDRVQIFLHVIAQIDLPVPDNIHVHSIFQEEVKSAIESHFMVENCRTSRPMQWMDKVTRVTTQEQSIDLKCTLTDSTQIMCHFPMVDSWKRTYVISIFN